MKIVCFIIHGVGSQEPNFALKFRQALDKRLQTLIARKLAKKSEAWAAIKQPSHIVEYQELYWANVTAPGQDALYRRVFPELFVQRAGARALSIRLIGDVFSYLGKSQEAIKRDVFDQFTQKLKEKVNAGVPFSVIIVGHSLGSVILHDIISGLVRYRYTGLGALVRCASVFTMGSPISLFSLVTDALQPDDFLSWVNFLHRRDLIAFPMHELSNAVRDVEVRAFTLNPFSAHSCYWEHPVVHSEIEKEIEKHITQQIAVTPSNLRLPRSIPPEVLQPLHGPALTAGFSDYEIDFNKIPFDELIEGATQIDICNVYGGSWYRTNGQYFVNAFRRGAKVRVCMLSPDSPSLPGFCHHYSGMAEQKLKDKIEDSKKEIKLAYDNAQKLGNGEVPGSLAVYLCRNIINHGFYRFDDLIYFVPRPISSPRNAATPIPTVVLRITGNKADHASWVMKDFEALFTVKGDFILDFDSKAASMAANPMPAAPDNVTVTKVINP